MKYNIKIGDKSFEVEIDDINTRPIIARVDGQDFEVTPEIWTDTTIGADQRPATATATKPTNSLFSKVIVAPLPGTVIDIFIKPGDEVESGQVIMIIEAMKMKNSIRSIRDGIVASVPVSAGQTVIHKQILVEFQE